MGWVDLQAPDVGAQLEPLRPHRALVGMRHIVQAEPDELPAPPGVLRAASPPCATLDLAYDILIYPRHLPVAAEFAVAGIPNQRFVLDHLGKPDIRRGEIADWRRDLARLAARPTCGQALGPGHGGGLARWTPDQMRPYLDVAFECFGPSG